MIVSEFITTIKQSADYFPGSLCLKSSDINGCVYKWLSTGSQYASRREIFIELDPTESELELLNKVCKSYIEIYPAY